MNMRQMMTLREVAAIAVVTALMLGATSRIAGAQQPASSPGQGSEQAARGTGAVAAAAVPDSRYRLQKGDSFELMFPLVPTFNQTVTVQPDGFVSLRFIGDQQVDGLTVSGLSEVLRGRYASVLRDPVVTVELRDFERPYFVAAGEVERPGRYDLRGATTLMQALAVAGGFREGAKRTNIAVFRRAADGPRNVFVQEVDARKLLDGRQSIEDPRIEPGDLVFVSKRKMPSLSTITNAASSLGWLAIAVIP